MHRTGACRDRANKNGVGHAQRSYVTDPYNPQTVLWRVEGHSSGVPTSTPARPAPWTFPAALIINVARLTLVSKCTNPASPWYPCP